MEKKTISKHESWGGLGHTYLELIFGNSKRELTKDEISEIQTMVNKISDKIDYFLVRNPEQRHANVLELIGCFPPNTYYEVIENQYWRKDSGEAYNNPWITVYTKLGPITIGWRSSVIVIDWITARLITKTTKDTFLAEDVTKSEKMIHAWGIEKAKEYIKELLK